MIGRSRSHHWPAPDTSVGAVNSGGTEVVWLAAVGDLHVTPRTRGLLRADLAHVHQEADVLLLAGDLTNGGRLDEAHVLTGELAEVGVAVVAVLGNHDHDEGHGQHITAMLHEAGVVVLDGSVVVFDVRGISLGIAGFDGFDGGFAETSQDSSVPHRAASSAKRRHTAAPGAEPAGHHAACRPHPLRARA